MTRSVLLSLLAAVLALALLLPPPSVQARGFGGRGGGMGGGGGFPGGGRNNGQNGQGSNPFGPRQPKPEDPQAQAKKTQEKVEVLLSNGFVALKASDTAAALEDFSDVLQLVPGQPLGHLGMGLVRAQKGKFVASQAEFTAAVTGLRKEKAEAKAKALADAKAKAEAQAKARSQAQAAGRIWGGNGAKPASGAAGGNGVNGANGAPNDAAADAQAQAEAMAEMDANLRVANYDLAVAFSRSSEPGRAMVLLDKMIGESKPPDEMLVNAQRSLVAGLDPKGQASVSALPTLVKTLDSTYALLRSAHSPLARWGVTWMASEEAGKHRQAREAEPLPKLLPFLMPGEELMPEPLLKMDLAQNPLSPVVAGQVAVAANAAGNATGNAGEAAGATTNPAGSSTPATSPAAPATPAATGVAAAQAGTASPSPAAAGTGRDTSAALRTVSGAAFAVAPDLLVTCARLTAGSKAIQVETGDGTAFKATVVASDDAAGVSLLQVEGGHFTPLPLADAARGGSVTVPAFSKPSVFGPGLETLRGDLSAQAAGAVAGPPGPLALRTSTHPRSAGSPVLDAQGRVVAVVTATRDDPIGHLPVTGVEAVQKLTAGKVAAGAASAGATDAARSVFELTAARED